MTRTALSTTSLSLLVALSLVACGGGDEAAPVDETPIVGLYELPISRNNQGTAPTDAARIEISPTELRVDHTKVLDLTRGRPAEAQVVDHVFTALLVRLRGSPARARVSLKVHATVPYLTLVETLNTVQQAGIREVHFGVRTVGATPAEGWMPLRAWRVIPQEGEIPWSTPALPWPAFSEHWREVYEACRAGQYVDCDAPYTNIAQGGELEMVLWTRGMAMKVTFSQINPPEVDPAAAGAGGGAQLIEGIARPARPAADAEPVAPPATTGAFTLRHQESSQEPSAISNTVAPVCSNQACRAIVDADATGQSMRVLGLLGAVYANGFTPGEVAFRLPED